jgi:acyl-CoA reductase-like NAD-dependent aldehyde dehydrogenase
MGENSRMSLDKFYSESIRLAEAISNNSDEIVTLLSTYETYDAAQDEVERSISTLKGFENEFNTIRNPLDGLNIATFFPLNLPLYSLVLFGIAPSAFSANVFIRPPELMQGILAELWNILQINQIFPAVSLHNVPRHIFVQLYASESDAILFTGKYENALIIHKACPFSLLMYNGSGINPFILFDDADVDLAVKKAVEMRCFNSGQDCAGPDAFFIPSSLREAFTDKLMQALKSLRIGDTNDPEVRVGPIIKQTYISELLLWLKQEQSNIIFGGNIDNEQHLVDPTIIHTLLSPDYSPAFHEFFAPYFNVLEYPNLESLERAISDQSFQEHAMYASVFGNNQAVEKNLSKYVRLLKNQIVNDTEQGNLPYGGYGSKANFLLYGTQKIIQPLLISRDLHTMLAP